MTRHPFRGASTMKRKFRLTGLAISGRMSFIVNHKTKISQYTIKSGEDSMKAILISVFTVLGLTTSSAGIAQVGPMIINPDRQATPQPFAKPDRFFHFRDADTEVIIRAGEKVAVNPGLNNLLPPRTMTCKSASGCEISISLIINITTSTNQIYEICSSIDGVAAMPTCFSQPTFTATNLQSLEVGQGKHVVQTQFLNEGNSGVIGQWQVNYTLYEGH